MYINTASHYLPETIISNQYYTTLNGLTDEWIYRRSGIRNRTKASSCENTNTMAIEAVKAAIRRLPYQVGEVDLIVGATYTPYDTVGTLAHAVQSYFDIPKVRAVSVSSACSSFINAVEVVEGYFATNKATKAIVVASEHNSAYSDDKDTQSGHLWGDGAGAIFISKEKSSDVDVEVLDLNTTALAHIGKGVEGVYLRPGNGGLKMPYGRDIFVHASKYMVSEVMDILKKNDFTTEDIDYLIPHQANSRIIGNVTESLGLRNGQLIMNIEETGNTGCASTLVAFSQNWDRFRKDQLIVLTVFGGGYSSGAMLLKK
ncbi:3-oxoacyl-ACP synthase III family protein [Syntrophorhabdus aromaticivorans]|uniref:3-oxoacyl-ACP synthase III family protein n=1 Tax=Syntrophorhabdus aromaticivorans TaxID=328301 RepID=A0A971M2G7_9BACT|nr:3-oxoacyl-ACP synthase III family protein [Syntrophorhabdus aromaticivorans]NLW34439.1 3-oxoacyl-ACP synthase III family protein [Syntrophorhabdus aromaticivorans]